jgi:uridine kinase
VSRVAVDGAGRTTFADKLAAALRHRGRVVIRASVGGFYRPRAVRHRLGRDSPEGFYRDSHEDAGLRRVLLDPLGPGGSLRDRTALFDVDSDQAVLQPESPAQPGSVLLVDALFLHRPEWRGVWDDSISLRVAFDVSVPYNA